MWHITEVRFILNWFPSKNFFLSIFDLFNLESRRGADPYIINPAIYDKNMSVIQKLEMQPNF